MTVEDIYRITSPAQNVDIYNPKTKVFVFTGVCGDIPLNCLDIPVSQVVAVDNTLAIMVEQ